MTKEHILHCTHCDRKVDSKNRDDLPFIMGGLTIVMTSPVMDTSSPAYFVGGCCASELIEWLEPALKLDEDYIKDRNRLSALLEEK